MLIEAVTVFLALIGTTLSCMNTGARVTYAMGKDNEVPEHFGMLHSDNLTPHRAIWTLATISAVVGVLAVSVAFGDGRAPTDADYQGPAAGLLSSFGYMTHDSWRRCPTRLLMITLASNFGTFLLYMLSCITCIVASTITPCSTPSSTCSFPSSACWRTWAAWLFYLVLPFMGFGTKMEPFGALGIAAGLGDLRRHVLPQFE